MKNFKEIDVIVARIVARIVAGACRQTVLMSGMSR
jgi:hypothetical protein